MRVRGDDDDNDDAEEEQKKVEREKVSRVFTGSGREMVIYGGLAFLHANHSLENT